MSDRVRQLRVPGDVDRMLADFPALRSDSVRQSLFRELSELGPHEVLVDPSGRGYQRTGR